jgi:hypothetical protein
VIDSIEEFLQIKINAPAVAVGDMASPAAALRRTVSALIECIRLDIITRPL